ncbi:MAG TPA: hypothetical protein VKI65_00340, partial [Gemmataceae bacterium]|nr:hypothetical protein [Gemmataceae bacterium]
MTEQLMEQPSAEPTNQTDDVVAAIQQVLRQSEEPLTLSKLKAQLPPRLRNLNIEEVLQRQAAANVLFQYPKYRSPQDRFWDRPMAVHVATLIRVALQEGPLGWSELRRKLPVYAQTPAETVLQQLIDEKRVYRHPRSGRSGDRFGLEPADPKTYLWDELSGVFNRLKELGFTEAEIRASALELLHDDEWAPTPAPSATPPQAEPSSGSTASEALQTEG